MLQCDDITEDTTAVSNAHAIIVMFFVYFQSSTDRLFFFSFFSCGTTAKIRVLASLNFYPHSFLSTVAVHQLPTLSILASLAIHSSPVFLGRPLGLSRIRLPCTVLVFLCSFVLFTCPVHCSVTNSDTRGPLCSSHSLWLIFILRNPLCSLHLGRSLSFKGACFSLDVSVSIHNSMRSDCYRR